MALFKNKDDANLPILTKIVQLNISDVQEVAEFLKRETNDGLANIQAGDNLGEYGIPQDMSCDENIYVAYCRNNSKEDLKAHDLVVRVMTDLATRGAVKRNDIDLANAMQAVLNIHWETSNEDYIPVESLREEHVSDSSALGGLASTAILLLLSKASKENKTLVAFCPECENPFVQGKRPYCSYRCTHRVREREKYALRFPEGKTARKPSENMKGKRV